MSKRRQITFDVKDENLIETVRKETQLRGETVNSASEGIYKLGFEIYLKTVPPKFQPIPDSEPIAITK